MFFLFFLFILIKAKFEMISENVNNTLELKQNEFNFLLKSKDEEIKFLSEEVFKINSDMDYIKRDRIRDQKLLNDYETQNNFLSNRIKEMSEKLIDESNNFNLQKKREMQTSNAQMEVFYYFILIFLILILMLILFIEEKCTN